MLWFVLALAASAAEEVSQRFVWDLRLDGQIVGERSLTLKYVPADSGLRRVMDSTTKIDGAAVGVPYKFEQRLSAHAGDGPASFHSVVSDNGVRREVQGRATPDGWAVSVVEKGRTRTWDLAPAEVSLSTADLVDPETRVPLSRYTDAKILAAESGAILSGKLTPLPATEITVGAATLPVVGYAFEGIEGRSEFFFSSSGALVRYDTTVLGKKITASLREMPDPGLDDVPIPVGGGGIVEKDL